jgi:hypothetical protein
MATATNAEAQAAAEAARSPKQFAEDQATDDATQAGIEKESPKPGPSPAVTNAASAPDATAEPEYRRRGKVQRDAGKKEAVGELSVDQVVAVAAPEGPAVRMMKESDVLAANRLDRVNLLIVHLLLLSALGLGGWKYVSRFNRTFDAQLPVPISGRALDALFPKTRAVLTRTAAGPDPAVYAERCVQKGEPVLLFAAADPWPQQTALPQLGVCNRTLLALPKLLCGAPGVPADPEFVFDAAWFGRYAVVVPGAALTEPMLEAVLDLLRARTVTRAAAARTVNLVWAHDRLPDAARLEELVRLCQATNFKLVAFVPELPPEAVLRLFEEVRR